MITLDAINGTISVDRPEPLVDYARSAQDFYQLQMELPWDEFMSRFEQLVTDRIAEQGTIDISARTAVFVATVT